MKHNHHNLSDDGLCMMHCINFLIGSNVYNEKSYAKLANDFDTISGMEVGTTFDAQLIYYNCDNDNIFSYALCVNSVNATMTVSEDISITDIKTSKLFGIVTHSSTHCTVIKPVGSTFKLLDNTRSIRTLDENQIKVYLEDKISIIFTRV